MKLVFDDLARFPHMGHIGRDERTFEWVVPKLPYIVAYEIRAEREEIVIAAVVHGARDRPPTASS